MMRPGKRILSRECGLVRLISRLSARCRNRTFGARNASCKNSPKGDGVPKRVRDRFEGEKRTLKLVTCGRRKRRNDQLPFLGVRANMWTPKNLPERYSNPKRIRLNSPMALSGYPGHSRVQGNRLPLENSATADSRRVPLLPCARLANRNSKRETGRLPIPAGPP